MILQTPEDFHEFRRKGLCGSDMAAILGKSNWQTPLDVYKRIKEGVIMEPSDEERVHWGKVLEGVITDRYETLNDIKFQRNIKIVHDKYEFIRGNSDGWQASDKILLEVKNIDKSFESLWYVNGKWVIPALYKFQVCHYASILNPDRIIFCVLFGGNKMITIPYERNLKLEGILLEKACSWWEKHIVKDNPPPPSKVSDLNQYVKIRPESTIEATPSILEKIQEIKKVKELAKKIVTFQEDVKLYCGAHEYLMKDGKIIGCVKEISSTRIDTDKLKENKMFD